MFHASVFICVCVGVYVCMSVVRCVCVVVFVCVDIYVLEDKLFYFHHLLYTAEEFLPISSDCLLICMPNLSLALSVHLKTVA